MKKASNILIIDDEEISSFVTSKLIEKAGITKNITCRKSGIDALDYLKQLQEKELNGPDVILLDLHLLDMTGWTFMKKFERMDTAFKSCISVYILSNFVQDREKQAAAQFNDLKGVYLKPISDELIEDIRCRLTPNGMNCAKTTIA